MLTSLNAESPLYDLFEGLGRRRALRRKGIDPDKKVHREHRQSRDDQALQNEPMKTAE